MNAKVTVKQPQAPNPIDEPLTIRKPEKVEDVIVTDSIGRQITIRQPSIVQEARFVRAIGDAALNAAYMAIYATPASMVYAIDGVVMQFPSSERGVEAILQNLDRPGITAVMDHITRHVRDRQAEESELGK
jgi:hypothetical protein